MTLRAVTLASKFLLVLFMGKYMSISELGTYGLFTVTCTLLLNLVGFDFYAYNSRELLSSPKDKHASMLRDQAIFHLFAYLLTLPLIPIIFKLNILDWPLLGWLYIILILEHICQEIERILINFSRPVTANAVLFIRSAIWVYVVIALYFYAGTTLSLTLIWQLWAAGVTGAIIFGVYQLKFVNFKNVLKFPVNYKWIYKGLQSASYLFIGTMLYQGMLFADRSILQHFHGEQAVGIYTFFWSIASAIYTFVYAGVISILHPKAIQSYNTSQNAFLKLIKKMFMQSSALFLVIFIILWFALDYVLLFTEKSELSSNKNIFFLLGLGLLFMTMSTSVQYIIYCKKQDLQLMLTTLVAFVVDIFANMLLVPNYAATGTAISLVLAMLALSIGRIFFAIKL